MSRMLCLAIVGAGLVAASGCSGFGNGCRRPSFMEFRGGGCGKLNRGSQMDPCHAPAAAPVCDPCNAPAPCCEGGGTMISSPGGVPVVSEPGTFS